MTIDRGLAIGDVFCNRWSCYSSKFTLSDFIAGRHQGPWRRRSGTKSRQRVGYASSSDSRVHFRARIQPYYQEAWGSLTQRHEASAPRCRGRSRSEHQGACEL